MSEMLAYLLAPASCDRFFEQYWCRSYFHVLRDQADYFATILTAADVDRLLQTESLPAAFFNVAENGVTHSIDEWSRLQAAARGDALIAVPDRLFALYGKGGTIILNQAQRAIPGVTRACSLLSIDMGFRVGANLYLSPPQAKGFTRHVDPHEVFILQIEGRKIFQIYPEGESPVEVEMTPGSLLYLPKGLSHEAKTGPEPSLHLSLGFHTPYGYDLLEDLAALARTRPEFQAAIPVQNAGPEQERDYYAKFAGHVRDLLGAHSFESLTERRRAELTKSQVQPTPGRLIDLLKISEITVKTTVRLRDGISFSVEDCGATFTILFGQNRISLHSFLRPAVDTLFQNRPVVVNELPGLLDDRGKMELVARLIRCGLLTIVA